MVGACLGHVFDKGVLFHKTRFSEGGGCGCLACHALTLTLLLDLVIDKWTTENSDKTCILFLSLWILYGCCNYACHVLSQACTINETRHVVCEDVVSCNVQLCQHKTACTCMQSAVKNLTNLHSPCGVYRGGHN
jgi:hypothetical protein